MAPGPGSPFTSGSQQRVGQYQYVTELSASVLGPLWAAFVGEGTETGRVVVARRIDTRALPPGSADRFDSAARAAAKIRDPSLAASLDVVRSLHEIVVVSEYVDGESLSTLMRLSADKRMPIPVPVAMRIGKDVLASLRAARNGWHNSVSLKGPEHVALLAAVYGGLSPEHVFVANYGDAVLSEVGVTGVAATFAKLGRHPAALAYRAPEQLNAAQPDERTDIFSLGAILWEMLATRPLFGDDARFTVAGANMQPKPGEGSAVADRLRDKPVVRLDSLERTGSPIPLPVANFVDRCLQRVPGLRFQTIEEAQHALRTLGDELVATPDQVSIFVDRLARARIDERRKAISFVLQATRGDSTPPTSSRQTLRPEKPGGSDDVQFRDSERPTLHHVGVLDAPSGAGNNGAAAVPPTDVLAVPQISLGDPQPEPNAPPAPAAAASRPPPPPRRAAPVAALEPEEILAEPRLSPLGTEVPVPSPPVGRSKGPRPVIVVAAVAILVGAAVGTMIVVKGRSGSPAAVTDAPRKAEQTARSAEMQPAAASAIASQTPTVATEEASAAPANSAEAATSEPALPTTGAPRTTQQRRGSAAGPTHAPSESSSHAKGAFRPSGI